MIVELGHFALILAAAVALAQGVLPIVGARRGDERLMAVAPYAAITQFLLIGIAFAVLMRSYIVSDFSVLNVVQNSHTDKPLLYKITGVWGNHEGSMLLWVLILALFGALVGAFGRNLPQRLKATVLSVQAWIGVSFLAFILTTSNPFLRVAMPPLQGNDLNPVLQDIGLAIHPPLLYIGYVGCSISFAFAVAALIDGKIDAAWARWVRPWTLGAWLFLTVGIAMGSYWAYYELGWGGFWFWDPVENSSFMPWLAATALLHSAVVMEKRNALRIWTVLLAILTFSLSLLGTFLVRSGVLTSVHTFAVSPSRGLFILAILVIFIGGSLALFAFRAQSLSQGGIFAPISREGALVLNNLFLTAAAATVLVGTLYPLLVEAITGDRSVSVGPPFFNLVFTPLVVPLLLAVPFGPLLAWKRGDLYAAAQRLMVAFGAALVGVVLVLVLAGFDEVLAAFGIGIAIWLIVGALSELASRAQFGQRPLSVSLARLAGLPRSAFGMTLAHLGVGLTVLGIVASTTWNEEVIVDMTPGETIIVGGRALTLDGYRIEDTANYSSQIARFTLRDGDRVLSAIETEVRLFTSRPGEVTTEAGIRTFGFSQLYVSRGELTAEGVLTVRAFWKPLVTLIWLGAVVMAIGGLLSLSDRRLRVGAPKPARGGHVVAPAE
ncbi:MAG: heme lyase CcmF/NrfE family subunit [Bauldia sp.]|nr:heme lyase CcmF/NrfE family subunit [Bauldia sp.]